MTPFLVATLLALLIAGVLYQAHRQNDRRAFRRALGSAALFVVLFSVYAAMVAGGKLSRADAGHVVLGELKMTEAAGSYRVSGVAYNRATDLVLTSLPLQLRVEDCAADDQCQPVYEGSREMLVTIQPGGSVPFAAVFVADPVRVAGERRWLLQAGDPKAQRP